MTGSEISIAQLLRQARERGLASLDAEVLVARALGRPRSWLRGWPEHRCTAAELAACESVLARRIGGEPVAYVLGEREFWSLPLQVDEHTLIPRADTEALVEHALHLRDTVTALAPPSPRARILDLGTGCGAIALALAKENPRWEVTATDASPGALRLATINAERLGVPLRLREGHWWAAVDAIERFALVVSNPPYLRQDDPHLRQGDLRFEPQSALASGVDGLDALREIIAGAQAHLEPGGWLLVEHGYQQGAAVRTLFHRAGFEGVDTRRDLAGHERMTQGRRAPPPALGP